MKINQSVIFSHDAEYIAPVQWGADTILSLAQRQETLTGVLSILQRLEPDELIRATQAYYRSGLEKFEHYWRYADQLTCLYAAASQLQVENYLEIGVLRGRSISVVAHLAPQAHLHGFDLWQGHYAGLENPGPEFVRAQLKRVGHTGQADFIAGDARQTVLEFLHQNPDLYFDLITVDGDHRETGARADLEQVLPRLKLGGVLVFDDLAHPKHLILEQVWDEAVGGNPNFASAKFTDAGNGVAVAVRRSTDSALDSVTGDHAQRLDALSRQYRTVVETLRDTERALETLRKHVETLEENRAADLDEIRTLHQRLVTSEDDRAARLERIQRLERQLAESEADRVARLKSIQALEKQLKASEKDRAARLETIHKLEQLLKESEADRAARLDVILRLEQQLEEIRGNQEA